MEKDPVHRYQSVDLLATELYPFRRAARLRRLGLLTPHTSFRERATRLVAFRMSPVLQTGRYEILENLGCGAILAAWTSAPRHHHRPHGGAENVSPRFLARTASSDSSQEAQTVGRLSHTSIAQLYDVGNDGSGTPFLVMEFVSGKNLEHLLAHSAIPFASAAVWTADLASALAYAHRAGIIHGDVTPSNIRVTEDDRVKLVDFGVARFAVQVSGSDRVLGTPAYLSPEQIEGRKQDSRSDLFSLGIVLYEMITGVRPFGGNSLGEVCAQILTANPIPPSQLQPTLPAAFDRILARCLAKNPDNRYQSGNDLARALYLVARCQDKLCAQPSRPYWFMRPGPSTRSPGHRSIGRFADRKRSDRARALSAIGFRDAGPAPGSRGRAPRKHTRSGLV